MFFGALFFFYDLTDAGNLISDSSAFSKFSLTIWKFSVILELLKTHLEKIEHYFVSVWDECSCVIAWIFFAIIFLWDWHENWSFPVLWPLLSFPNLLAYSVPQTFTASSFRIWNSSTGIPSPPIMVNSILYDLMWIRFWLPSVPAILIFSVLSSYFLKIDI